MLSEITSGGRVNEVIFCIYVETWGGLNTSKIVLLRGLSTAFVVSGDEGKSVYDWLSVTVAGQATFSFHMSLNYLLTTDNRYTVNPVSAVVSDAGPGTVRVALDPEAVSQYF